MWRPMRVEDRLLGCVRSELDLGLVRHSIACMLVARCRAVRVLCKSGKHDFVMILYQC